MTATALLLLVPLSAPPAPPAETVVDNRTVAAWVADLQGEDYQKQVNAYHALLGAGPKAKDAVPALAKMLAKKDGRWAFATEILGAIGPDAKETVPALIALLPKDDGFGYSAETVARALAKIDGPKIEATRSLLLSSGKCQPILLEISQTLHGYPGKVVPQVVALCDDKDAKVREKAATILGLLKQRDFGKKVPTKTLYELAGDGAKGVVPALEKLLADDVTAVRLAAALATAYVAPELADKVIPVVVAIAAKEADTNTGAPHATDIFRPIPKEAAKALIPLLGDKSDKLRMWAVNTLASLPVREAIENALKNGKTARSREGAAITLGARYGDYGASLPALTVAQTDGDFAVRFAAAKSLVYLGGTGSEAYAASVPVLVEGLQQTEEKTRFEASQGLLMVGPVAKDAIPALKKLLGDEKPGVRLEAALALVAVDAKIAAGAVPVLTEGLKASDMQAIRSARALAELGPVAKDAVPQLLKHFTAKNLHLRVFSAEAAALIDPAQAPKAVDVLTATLKDAKRKSDAAHQNAVNALKRIGPGAKPAMPTLAELLKDETFFRADVAAAMITIDADGAKPAYDWIRTVLNTPDHEDAYDVVDQLPKLGAQAKPLLPELLKMLQSKAWRQRDRAILTLAAIGPDAKDALPELKKIAEGEPRNDIRKHAAEAVKKIEAK